MAIEIQERKLHHLVLITQNLISKCYFKTSYFGSPQASVIS
jgi:hypothetical protein